MKEELCLQRGKVEAQNGTLNIPSTKIAALQGGALCPREYHKQSARPRGSIVGPDIISAK
jgi:hypothetical protein